MGGGKKAIVTGYNYWGSLAAYICLGPVKRLHRITNGDTVIWSGPITSASADSNGCTILTTTLGSIRFYWGTFTQNPDAILSTLEIDRGSGPELVPMPAFRGLCYFVADDIAFGQQVTPPTLKFLYERESSGLAISSHLENGDAVLPEAIYDLLTNGLYGDGVAGGDLNTASFVAAAEKTIDEGLVASPDIDSAESSRELIGRLLGYIDGTIYFDGGQFVMKLNRVEDATGLPTITEADLLEEPEPDTDQFDQTWSRTIVTFHDRENKWEETGAEYEDKANAAIVGRKKTKVIPFPWVTRRAVADQMAVYQGLKGGLPHGYWRLVIDPARTDLRVGMLVKLTYARRGIVDRIVRIKRRARNKPSDPSIQLEVYEERQRDIGNEYFPNATYTIPGNTHDFTLPAPVPRLSWLPADLKEGAADGFMVALQRPASGGATGGEIWWTWNPVDQPYQLVAAFTTFPAKGTVLSWWHVRGGANWILRVQFDADQLDWLQALKEEAPEVFAVIGVRKWPSLVPDMLSPWMRLTPGGTFNLISPTVVEIEIDGGGRFGSDPISLEDEVSEGRYPTQHIYFGRVEDFGIYATDVLNFDRNLGNAVTDTGLLRYIKTPLENTTEAQSTTDVAAVTYDRNDFTASPQGTYSRDWGTAVTSAYEVLDVSAGLRASVAVEDASYPDVDEFDDALGAIFAGTATADQTFMAESIDDVLGAMAESNQTKYHP